MTGNVREGEDEQRIMCHMQYDFIKATEEEKKKIQILPIVNSSDKNEIVWFVSTLSD